MTRAMPFAVALASTVSVFGQHTGDVWPGVTAAGQLTISASAFVPDRTFFDLAPFGLGWIDDSPGFDRVLTPEPENDVYPLANGAQVWLRLVAADPAMKMVDAVPRVLKSPGDETFLGTASDLHVHNAWWIDSTTNSFDPEQCVWESTWVLVDKGTTNYAASALLAFRATNVPLRYSQVPIPPATGDFNGDSAVDAADLPAFVECLAGANARPAPDDPLVTTCEVECLNAFDFDNDLDVDLRDYARLMEEVN